MTRAASNGLGDVILTGTTSEARKVAERLADRLALQEVTVEHLHGTHLKVELAG